MAAERCFAFVDLAGYTAMTEAHGDDGAAAIAARFYTLAAAAAQGDTRVVKRIGDAVMLVSSDVTDCVRTVLRMFEDAAAERDFLGLRAGVCAGTAVESSGDYFGAAVNLAARVGAHARAGQILCSGAVAREAARVAGVDVVALGSVSLKNVRDDVELFGVVVRSLASDEATAVDPVCRMRVGRVAPSAAHDGVTYWFCSEACAAEFRSAPERWVPRGR